ncbi:hypothetical protein IP88_10490 [alpha proteobacterium AAP81b]|nr:hypothetical protein IP88_10490 [alpha proteobacterium AAP81b]
MAAVAAVALAGCERNPLEVRRSVCPAVAVPAYAGDITLFRPGTPPDAGNIDVVATITNVRGACNDQAATLTSDVSFDVVARRSDSAGARDVALPVFATVVQGGNLIVSKQIGSVTVRFADGSARTVARGGMRANVLRSAAALPPDLLKKVSRKRRAQDLDASVDPMSDPQIRAAMRAASFEVLVGFQLDETRLAYNVAK